MKERNFKPLTPTNSTASLSKGNASPVSRGLSELGLTEASANGEAVVTRKTKTNPKGSGRKPKTRDKTFYPNHTFIELYPKNAKEFVPIHTLEPILKKLGFYKQKSRQNRCKTYYVSTVCSEQHISVAFKAIKKFSTEKMSSR